MSVVEWYRVQILYLEHHRQSILGILSVLHSREWGKVYKTDEHLNGEIQPQKHLLWLLAGKPVAFT